MILNHQRLNRGMPEKQKLSKCCNALAEVLSGVAVNDCV